MPRPGRMAAFAAVAALSLSACANGGSGSGAGQSMSLGTPSDVASWDPAVGGGATSLAVLSAVYSSLTTVRADQSVGPGLATSWSYDAAKTRLTLTLRGGVVFSDGTKLDAAAVKANLDRDVRTPGVTAQAIASVKDVTVSGPGQVVIDLKTPDPGLLYNLGGIPGMIASPKAFGGLATTPVGSGPYLLDLAATTRGSSYAFARNPKYNQPPKYPFDRITVKVLADTNAQITAVTSGQIDAGGIPAAALSRAKAAGLTAAPVTGLILGMWIVDRNGKLNPALAQVKVRQAINYALDASGILKAIGGGSGVRTSQLFNIGSPAYLPALNNRYPYDPAKAKQLLAEAGYPNGFTLALPSENAYLPTLYPVVAQELGQVGIKVKYTPISVNQITQQLLSGKFPAFMYTYTATQNWIDASNLLAATGTFNPFHVNDPTISGLLGRIAVADGSQQASLFQQLNTYAVEQAWFAPLYASTNFQVWNAHKVKVHLAPGQFFPLLSDYRPAG